MSLTKFIRDAQSKFEAIPAPCAIFYDAIVVKILRKPEKKIINDIVEKIGSGAILDLGSGTGYLSIGIAKRVPGLQVYGIDLSRQMVKIARRHAKGIENAQFVFGNAADLPFEGDSIDFIVSTGSLHHWKKPVKVFDECYRVLRNGKEAWIYDPCPDALKDDIDKAKKEYGVLGRRFLIKITQLHGFSKEEYENKIKGILDQTTFKDSYQMELTDIWMKITLKK
ncbi:methyltransferase domain-containing protein [bacterium]|nr:methyltransferase domain-containing protein [bacterium]